MSVLRHSHDHLVQVVGALTDEQVKSRSYDTEWSIAQVLSHMGSGAEIFTMFVDAGLQGARALGTEVFPPVWDRWNAKAPGQQARDALAVDAAFLDQIDALSSDERENWHLTMFGADRSLREVAGMRAREHALHTWDVAVAIKPDATVLPDAVEHALPQRLHRRERVGDVADPAGACRPDFGDGLVNGHQHRGVIRRGRRTTLQHRGHPLGEARRRRHLPAQP